MSNLIFDLETNGLLPEVTTIHSLVIKDIDTFALRSYADQPNYPSLEEGLDVLAEADMIAGHNVIKYDLPVLAKLRPEWTTTAVVRDTLLLSRLIWPELKKNDFKMNKRGKLPGQMIGRYSLEAFGHRLGLAKVGLDIKDWSKWTPHMQARCEGDVELNFLLWEKLVARAYAPDAVELEHQFQEIMFAMEQHGWNFDVAGARKLSAKLSAKREAIRKDLCGAYDPWFMYAGDAEFKRTMLRKRDDVPALAGIKEHCLKGAKYSRVKLIPFEPTRDKLANRMKAINGWVPKEFTPEGKPKIDETILSDLDYPAAKVMNDYLLVDKRLGQVSEGPQAWLKKERKGRIHGVVDGVGTVTRRCAHSKPNTGQVPTVNSPYGPECRALWLADMTQVMLGVDASGLELRCLAHYMGRYDDGAYGRILINGDIHTANAIALGLDPKKDYIINGFPAPGREIAKRFIYAYLYGAGDEKLGLMAGITKEEALDFRVRYTGLWKRSVKKLRRDGRAADLRSVATIVKGGVLRNSFQTKTPALKRLRDDVAAKIKGGGGLRAIDGGVLHIRSAHSALNTLLQSCGSIVVKKATIFLCQDLSTQGLVRGVDWSLVGHIHDELQLSVREELANDIGTTAVAAIKRAGEHFNFRCPLDGEFKVGRNWAETH